MRFRTRQVLLLGIILLASLRLAANYGYAQSQLPRPTSAALFPLVFRANLPTPQPARLLISEVFFDPPWEEPDGEWVEIHNPGSESYPLGGIKLGDAEARGKLEGMYGFPSGASLGPGKSLVIASRAATFWAHFHRTPDFELRDSDPSVPDLARYLAWSPGSLSLVNSGDEVILLDEQDQVLDAVSWGDARLALDPPAQRVPEGHSLERLPADQDTDRASDWTDNPQPDPWAVDFPPLTPTPSPTAGANSTPSPIPTTSQPAATAIPTTTLTPTPSRIPTITPTWEPTPSGARLLISEVFYTGACSEPDCEWIEIYNAGGTSFDLTGSAIGDAVQRGPFEGMLLFPEGASLEPGQVAIIAHDGTSFAYLFGRQPDFEMRDTTREVPNMVPHPDWAGGLVNLNESGDEVVLIDLAGALIDSVSWGASSSAFDPPAPEVPEDYSLERYPPGNDRDTAVDWRSIRPASPGIVPAPAVPAPAVPAP